MRKTVLIVSNVTYGLYIFRGELIAALAREYDVKILAPDNGRVEELEQLGAEVIPVALERHGTNPLRELRLVAAYMGQMRRIRPDVVLTYTIKPNIYAGLAAARLGIPYISNVTGLGTAVEDGGPMQALTLFLYRLGLGRARKVFFQNAENRDFMLRHGVVRGAWELVPGSGVNLERYRAQPYPDDGVVRLIFVARVIREKGIDQFIEAAEAIRAVRQDVEFHVYGSCQDAGYQEKLRECEERGVLCYHGVTREMDRVYASASCTVHPSFYPEGMSNVLLESCASARPVIASDRPGCREAVDDGVNGYLVRERDAADLIEKIERFLALPWERRREMGLAGRAKVEREFDRRIVVEAYRKEIAAALGETAR